MNLFSVSIFCSKHMSKETRAQFFMKDRLQDFGKEVDFSLKSYLRKFDEVV